MKNTLFKGAGVAIVTPFNDDLTVNYEVFEKLINFNIENNTDAIIVCGTTGESATLSDEEHKKVIEFAVKIVNGRIPVIAGTGSNDTNYAIQLSKHAQEVGVDGLLIVTPYYNKATQQGLITHYKAIADSVDIPIIVYSVPSRTGCNVEPETIKELSKHKNIVGIKEASGNISQVAKIAAICGDDIDIYSGNDDQIVPILSLGGVGVISVMSNILPKETHDICQLYFDGKVKESLALANKLNKIANDIFLEVNPIPAKAALELMGYDAMALRLPLTPMSEGKKVILAETMKEIGLI